MRILTNAIMYFLRSCLVQAVGLPADDNVAGWLSIRTHAHSHVAIAQMQHDAFVHGDQINEGF